MEVLLYIANLYMAKKDRENNRVDNNIDISMT